MRATEPLPFGGEPTKSGYAAPVARMKVQDNQEKFSAVLKSLSGRAALPNRADDDVTLRRNLIMSMG